MRYERIASESLIQNAPSVSPLSVIDPEIKSSKLVLKQKISTRGLTIMSGKRKGKLHLNEDESEHGNPSNVA
jgi:hypothetical protein